MVDVSPRELVVAIAARADGIAAAIRDDGNASLATTAIGVRWLRTEVTSLHSSVDILAERARPVGSTSVICTLDLALTSPEKELLLFYLQADTDTGHPWVSIQGRQAGKASARASLIRYGLLLASPETAPSGVTWLSHVGQTVARHIAAARGERPIP